MYDDDQEIGAELRRLASADPLSPISSSALLARGRRGRLRRKLISSGGVVAAVSAVALTATLLPHPGQGPGQAVAGSSGSTSAESPARRVAPPSQNVAPTADTAAVLKACSVKLAAIKKGRQSSPLPVTTDLTGWRMLVRSIQPKVGTAFVATSPDGKLVARCVLYAPGVPAGYDKASNTWAHAARPSPRTLTEYLFGAGSQCAPDLACTGFLNADTGEVPRNVVRIRLEAAGGRSVDVPVRDGWFAVMWANGGKAEMPGRFTAYDASGKVVKPDPDFVKKMLENLHPAGTTPR